MRFIFGIIVGVIITGMLNNRGIDLPDHLGHIINGGEVQQLGRDITHAVKKP